MSGKSFPPPGPKRGGAAAERVAGNATPKSASHDPRTSRRWPRIHLNAEVLVRVDRLGARVNARILNASERGLFLAMDDPRPIGTRIRLTIQVADPPLRTEIAGIVIHVVSDEKQPGNQPPGVGVFLDEVDDAWIEFCRARQGPAGRNQPQKRPRLTATPRRR